MNPVAYPFSPGAGTPPPELAALVTARHRCEQRRLPVTLVGAGLPQLRGRMGRAKSYAERPFDVPEVGALPASDAASPSSSRCTSVRFDRLTPVAKKYLRAMAELGPGPHRSGDVAEEPGRKVTSLGPIRNQIIAKGMIWSPHHGDTAFTVPLFDAFMHRIMPGEDWRQ